MGGGTGGKFLGKVSDNVDIPLGIHIEGQQQNTQKAQHKACQAEQVFDQGLCSATHVITSELRQKQTYLCIY